MSKGLTARRFRGLSEYHCRRMDYEFRTSLDKFDLAAFRKELASSSKEKPLEGTAFSGVARTYDRRKADYHVHFHLSLRRGQAEVILGYVQGALKPERKERRPYAEDVMRWLGSFLAGPRASAHVTGVFSYPRREWRTALPIPLPIRLPLGEKRPSVELDGVSLNMRQPHAIAHIWVGVGEDEITCLVATTRMADFNHFSLYSDVGRLSRIAKTIVERKIR